MNGNPEGTPNPLNPNPGVAGAAPVPPAQPAVPTPAAAPAPAPAPAPATATPVAAPTAAPVAPAATPVASEPEQKGTIVEPAKKSKKGVVITIVLILVVLICGAAAALFFLNPFAKEDKVVSAVKKLFQDGAPTTVVTTGVVNVTPGDESDLQASIKISFTSGFKLNSSENYANATVTVVSADNNEYSFGASEIRTAETGSYIKLSNAANFVSALQNLYGNGEVNSEVEATDCLDAEGGKNCTGVIEDLEIADAETVDVLSELSGVFEAIDDQWIYLPSASFDDVLSFATTSSKAQCLIDVAGDLGNYPDDFSELYKQSPFITYSTENLSIAQKKDPLYHLSFDAEKMTDFLNSMSTAGFINDLGACMGDTATNTVSLSEVQETLAELPGIYVEIDENNNFTRVYLTSRLEDGSAITADLSFTYPASINVEEPAEYMTLENNEILWAALILIYGNSMYDDTSVEGYDSYEDGYSLEDLFSEEGYSLEDFFSEDDYSLEGDDLLDYSLFTEEDIVTEQ